MFRQMCLLLAIVCMEVSMQHAVGARMHETVPTHQNTSMWGLTCKANRNGRQQQLCSKHHQAGHAVCLGRAGSCCTETRLPETASRRALTLLLAAAAPNSSNCCCGCCQTRLAAPLLLLLLLPLWLLLLTPSHLEHLLDVIHKVCVV
jgi:hypothetical protein